MDTITPDWSSLPPELLTCIAKCLHTRIDVLRFRAVCRSFRCILPCPPNVLFPKSILSNLDFLRGPNPNDYDLFYPIESTFYAIQPLENETSQTWFVKIVESKPGRVQIKDPLSGYRFKRKLSKLPNSLNLLDYRVKEISRSYTLESAAIRKGKAKLFARNDGDSEFNPSVYEKVIFSSFVIGTDDDQFAVMAPVENELSVWRNIDKKWTNIDLSPDFLGDLCDIMYHNQKFYASACTGLTVTVDIKSLNVTEVAAGLQRGASFWLLCRIESSNDLISIVGYEDHNTDDKGDVRFFKLNEDKREWFPMVDGPELEDTAFFLSEYCLYSVSAKEFSGCRGNSLYFTDEDSDSEPDHPGQAARIADLKQAARTVDSKDRRSKKLSEFPGYSDLFWPPPTWLK